MFKGLDDPYIFIGRVKESKQLGKLFNESLERGTRMALIGGDTGIGKTAMLQQLKGNVKARGGYYLICKSGPLGSAYPYHPLAELMRILIEQLGQNTVKEVITGYSPRVLSELSLLVPKLASMLSNSVKGYQFSENLPDKLFLENACSIVRALLCNTPVVLIIEDIPYADHTTLEVIEYFIHHQEEFRILVCGTYDLDDIDLADPRFTRFRSFIRTLNYEDALVKINLAPFTREETEEFLNRLLDEGILPSGLVDIIYQKSEGNPLIIRHLVGKLIETGNLQRSDQGWIFSRPRSVALPEEIQEMFLIRLESVKPELRAILATAAVIGRRFSAQYLAQLLGKTMLELLPLLEEAIRLKFIEEFQDSGQSYFSFVSSRLQEVLYESISYQRKVLLHEKIGLLLEQTMDPRLHPDDFAYHFQWGADKVKAVQYAIMAGQRAISLYAFHIAWRHFSTARDFFPLLNEEALQRFRYPVLEGLAESSSFLGYYSEAWKCLGQLLGVGISKGTMEYASVQCKMGDLCFRMGHYTETLKHYNLALESGTDEQKRLIINRVIQTYLEMGRFDEAQSLAELQLLRAEATGDSLLLNEILGIHTLLYFHTGEMSTALRFAERLAAVRIPNDLAHLFTKFILGLLTMESGPLAKAEELLLEGLDNAKKMQDPLLTGQIQVSLARVYILQGNYLRAREILHSVKPLGVYGQSLSLRANVFRQRGTLALIDKSTTAAQNLMEESTEIDKDTIGLAQGLQVLLQKAELAALCGMFNDSCQLLQQAEKLLASNPTPRYKVCLMRAKAVLQTYSENPQAARTTVKEALKLCHKHGMYSEGVLICTLWPGVSEDQVGQQCFAKLNLEQPKSVKHHEEEPKQGEYLPKEVGSVLDYIHCQYASDLNMATLCRVANLSERQLRRVFTQYTGISIREYINSYRIEKAKELLLNPTLGIAEVGALVGLNDKSHFCKTFKTVVGVSPTEFRKTQPGTVRNGQQILS